MAWRIEWGAPQRAVLVLEGRTSDGEIGAAVDELCADARFTELRKLLVDAAPARRFLRQPAVRRFMLAKLVGARATNPHVAVAFHGGGHAHADAIVEALCFIDEQVGYRTCYLESDAY